MFLKNWGDIEERLDPLYYLNMMLLHRNIIEQSKYEVKDFKQLVNMQRGRFGHRPRNDPRYYGGKYPFIQTGNIVKASTSNSKIQYTQTLNELGVSTSRIFDEKVVVITIAANIGFTAILDYDACFPDSLVALTTDQNIISLEYLNIYTRLIRRYIENLAPQAAQKNINLKQLSKIPLIVPDLDVQNKIVKIMDNAYKIKQEKESESQNLFDSINDYLLEELEISLPYENKNTLKERKFYISSSKAQNERLDPYYYNPQFFENLNQILNGRYKCVKLRSLALNGLIKGKLPTEEQRNGECKVLQIGSINKDGTIDDSNLLKSKDIFTGHQKLINGDIIVVATGATIGKIGFCEDLVDCYLGGDLFKFNTGNSDYGLIISYLLKTKPYQMQISRCITGATNGHLSESDIGNLLIPYISDKDTIIEIANVIKQKIFKASMLKRQAFEAITKAKSEVDKILLGGESI